MAGITHKKVSAIADGVESDLVLPSDWNDTHNITEYAEIIGGSAAPTTPAAGKVRHYVITTGTTPNRTIKIGYVLEDGTDVSIYEATI
jgi:hypothetical protein